MKLLPQYKSHAYSSVVPQLNLSQILCIHGNDGTLWNKPFLKSFGVKIKKVKTKSVNISTTVILANVENGLYTVSMIHVHTYTCTCVIMLL